ncbi:MAG: signal peptidase [Planctomycetes bacterium]|nr:signal peptidase [Planctomycetota bacterium]
MGQYIVRYGSTHNIADFSAKGSKQFSRNCAVIVRTNRGVEWGTVLCPATEKTQEYLGKSEGGGKVLREVSDDDRSKLDRLHQSERQEFDGCCEMIRQHKLQMQLVDIEHLFGGERLIFYYLAEKRVDFRELVKALAKRFRTRIEMRQIGVRDEAKLLADYGDCGKPVCCNTHLREMPPVSMKMAKLQKATLDPTKISGRCGRLKCCLRYEYDTYVEYRRELPKVGSTVVTKQGQGLVVGLEILAKKIMVQYEDNRRIMTDQKDVLTVVGSSEKTHNAASFRTIANRVIAGPTSKTI